MPLADWLRRRWKSVTAYPPFLWRRLTEDRCLQAAGSLAYTTLLALVPLIAVVLAVSTAFPVFNDATGALNDWLTKNLLPEQFSKAIAGAIKQFAARAGRTSVIGGVALAVTAAMLMLTIERGMNQIFRVVRQRPLLQRLINYWAVLTLGPLLMAASVVISSYVVSVSLGYTTELPGVAFFILRGTPIALTWIAVTLLYILVPNRPVRLVHALVGAFVAALLFEATKRGFALYVTHFPTYTMIYGAFAAVPVFLVWLYLSWLVVLIGATVTATLPGETTVERRAKREP